jgi:hypothetical protein
MQIAREEPLPSERLDWLFASVCAAIWDVNRDTEKHPNRFDIKDFLLKFKDPDEEKDKPWRTQTSEEQNRILMLWAMAYGNTSPTTYQKRSAA